MSIIKDNRKTNILYVDKENNSVYNNDNIIKLIDYTNNDIVNIYINIITAGLYLNKIEVSIINILIIEDNDLNIKDINIIIARLTGKSKATIARAIYNLRMLKLIYINENNIVKLSNTIENKYKDIKDKKLIAIEVIAKNTTNSLL